LGSDHRDAADDVCADVVVASVVVCAVVDEAVDEPEPLLVADADVLVAAPADGVDDDLLLPPHAAIATPTTMARTTAAALLDTVFLIPLSSLDRSPVRRSGQKRFRPPQGRPYRVLTRS
jgi:hypothetical protein